MRTYIFKNGNGIEEIALNTEVNSKEEFREKNGDVKEEYIDKAWYLLEIEKMQEAKFNELSNELTKED